MNSIVRIPNSILTTPTRTVKHFDNKLKRLVLEMKRILQSARKPKGVGLSANQIGKQYRVFIAKPNAKSEIRVFINPKIVGQTNEITENGKKRKNNNKLEGCLSIPDIWGYVKRAEEITLEYQDLKGKKYLEKISGFLSHIVQHEVDHLNGILFTRRVLEQKEKFFRSVSNDGKNVLEEIIQL